MSIYGYECHKHDTSLCPERYKYVSTSKLSGWVKLRLAPREIPTNEGRKVETYANL